MNRRCSRSGRYLAGIRVLGYVRRRAAWRRPLGGGTLALSSTERLFVERSSPQQSLFDDDPEFSRPTDRDSDRDSALTLLRFADLGIDDVQMVEDEDSEARRSMQAGREPRRQLRLMHRVAEQELPFDIVEESAGTQTWFALIGPAFSALRRVVLLFDEIDASLHPRLSARLLELFEDPRPIPWRPTDIHHSRYEPAKLPQSG